MKHSLLLYALRTWAGKKAPLSLVCLCLTATTAVAQQIPQYSQYLINGMLVNPAYTGYRETGYAQVFYHNQWMQAGTPQYFAFAIDGHLANGTNVGLAFSDERMGALAINSVAAAYAYRLRFDRADLSFGLSLGAKYYSLDYSTLRPFQPVDPVIQSLRNRWTPDLNIGVYYGSSVFYAGLSARNITDGRILGGQVIDDFIIPLSTWNAVLTAGFSIPLSERLTFRPSLMWQDDFAAPSHIDLTAALLFFDRFWVGLCFRTDQPFGKNESWGTLNELYSGAVMTEIFVTNQMTLSYAFDFGLNQDSYKYFGGHEIAIGYYFARKVDSRYNRRYRYNKYRTDGVCDFCP
ncbi:MAG: PorP/SprF family type IX secretion system membrane protein [Prevotellaceae bacterium]|jgi:type IX secretion system PorP/SprF family membrane protein|nr:PorP/SprF family type IX secretion system membrane protein [Prevotellaceae bacterium]